ncbi:hypothetical protein HaLaN_01368, partial [Haematococcus lacustris]
MHCEAGSLCNEGPQQAETRNLLDLPQFQDPDFRQWKMKVISARYRLASCKPIGSTGQQAAAPEDQGGSRSKQQ